jgi:hypothetical protein
MGIYSVPVEDPQELLHELTDRLFQAIDDVLEHPASRMVFTPDTYGRVTGLAALGHLCHGLALLRHFSENSGDPQLSSLLARHQLETWTTGICLMLGTDDDRLHFLGNARRIENIEIREREQLTKKGALPSSLPAIQEEFQDFKPYNLSMEKIFRRAATLLLESGVATGVDHLYEIMYRPLSNRFGAHPSPFVLDHYFSTERFFAQVFRVPESFEADDQPLPTVTLNFLAALLMTITYGCAAAKRLSVDDEALLQLLADYRSNIWQMHANG